MTEDLQLLADYLKHGSENAFTELVKRHLDLVYSAALREAWGDVGQAQDISQAVFCELAAKASTLIHHPALSGWLYTCVRHIAANQRRANERRGRREKESHIMAELTTSESTDLAWQRIRPVIDDAMHELNLQDRTVVVLRFFEDRTYKQVGEALGIQESAARKRIDRALEKLRELLARRDITSTSPTIASALLLGAVLPAPTILAATFAQAALTGTLVAAVTATSTNAIVMTAFQKTLLTLATLVAAGWGGYVIKQNSDLRANVLALQQRQTTWSASNQLLLIERDNAMQKLYSLREENERLRKNSLELLKLRGENGLLKKDSRDLAALKAGDPMISIALLWKERVAALKRHLEENPGAGIPEMKLATDRDWLLVANEDMKTDQDYRNALSRLRNSLEQKLANRMLAALQKYLAKNKDQFPAEISQLQPYFEEPVDISILQRYVILPKAEIPGLQMGGEWIISTRTPIDAELDGRVAIGPNGWGGTSWNNPTEATFKELKSMMKSFAADNAGREPTELTEVLPYVKTPSQRAAYETALKNKTNARNIGEE